MPPERDVARTVCVVDDEESVRRSVALLLEAEGFAVATYARAEDLLAEARRGPLCGCVVTDVKLAGLSGLDLLEALRELQPMLPVITITGHADVTMAVRAMKAGACDFLEKPFEPEQLIEAVSSALRTDASRDGIRAIRSASATLSCREREVLDHLLDGETNKEIAISLGLSPRTVEIYRGKLMLKMGASSLSDLIRMSVTAGLAEPTVVRSTVR